jgi:polynucleotide 5'-kinase involved in rRNA processing
VVVCFQQGYECERILTAYRSRQRPRILRFRPSRACRRRPMEARRLYREQTLQRYFANAQTITLPWDRLGLVDTPLWRGAAFEVSRAIRHGQLRLSRIIWAERHDDELRLVTESPLAPSTVIELERATRLRIRTWQAEELHGTLLGLLDEAGDTLGIGVLQRINFANHDLEVLAPAGLARIRGIHWSRTRMAANGTLQRSSC